MKRDKDKRKKLYRFLANEEESQLIESRYILSECSSVSEFFRQAIINDMAIQNSETELDNLTLLLADLSRRLHLMDKNSISSENVAEILREVDAAWQQLQSIQSMLHSLKH